MEFRMSTRGPFSLDEAARFQESFPAFDGGPQVELAFSADGSWQPVGVRVVTGLVAQVVANPGRVPVEAIREQVERILSLDVDGTGFADVGVRDEVVGDLQRQFPGLRPVLFGTPYEAAAWALLTHRISRTQAATLRRRLNEELGEKIDFSGHVRHTFPVPERLATLEPMPGMMLQKVENLRALGEAAAAGELDIDLLRGMSVEEAFAHLLRLRGIGPFSAELILLRGAGVVDLFPREGPHLRRAMIELYDLGPEPPRAQLEALTSAWAPFRGWVAFLLRNVA